MCHGALADLTQLGLFTPSRNIDLETEQLWAFLDGLTTHLLMNPEHTTTQLAGAVLRTHLTSLDNSAT